MTTLNQLFDSYKGEFMQPVIYFGRFFEVETDYGTEFVDQDLIGKTMHPSESDLAQYCEGSNPSFSQVIDGWGAYLSANGYMDRTELTVYETEEQAIESLYALIGD